MAPIRSRVPMQRCAGIIALIVTACLPPSAGGSRGSEESIDLVIATTTDVHGRLRGWDYFANRADARTGLARASTIIDSLRQAHPGRVVVLDAGDLLQGNPLTFLASRDTTLAAHPVVAAMNAVGYDASAIGNHEFNYGVPFLDRVVAQARFPFLSANTFRLDGSHAYRPWTIVERAGVRVGIIGATTPGVMVWDADRVRGKVRLGDIVPAVRDAVREVRAAGAEVVVAAIHSGLEGASSYDERSTGVPPEEVSARVAREVPGIDMIVYGHSHRENAGSRIGSTLLIQPKNWATSVAVAHLSMQGGAGRRSVASSRGTIVQSIGRPESPAVVAVAAPFHEAAVRYANTVIGTTPVAWSSETSRLVDTPIIDMVLEIERKLTGADLASASAFSTDLRLPAGDITIAQIAQLYPYENSLKAVRITGKQLRDYLEFSSRFYPQVADGVAPGATPQADPEIPGYNFDIVAGADYEMDITRPIGERITSLTFKGRPVEPSDSFTMAVNNYRQGGGGGYAMLKGAPVVWEKQVEIRELLIDEIRRRGVIRHDDFFVRNWKLVTTPGRGSGTRPQSGATLRIISTNDLHGQLEPQVDAGGVRRGGAAFLARAIMNARSECTGDCQSILVDGGDMMQGTAISNLSFGRPVIEYFNKMRYDAVAMGNHEWDWGRDTLRARMREATFPILGVNTRYSDGRDVPWIPNDTIITRGSWRIGVIGVNHVRTSTATKPANVTGFRFDGAPELIDASARALRARGANVVIVVAHEGGFCNRGQPCNGEIFKLAQSLREPVDAIVAGHSHVVLSTTEKNIPIVQARSSGRAVGIIDLTLDASSRVTAAAMQVRDVMTDSLLPLPAIDSIVTAAAARVAPVVSRRIATIRTPLVKDAPDELLGNLVADAQRWAGKGDVGVINNTGVRTGLRAGTANYGDLLQVLPFGNTLYSMRMRGSELKAYLEKVVGGSRPSAFVSGVTIAYDPTQPAGERITSLRLPAGKTFSEGAVYSVIVPDFLATGGSGLGPTSKSVTLRPLNIVDLDALIDYVRSLPQPVRRQHESRIIQMER